jgi:hypothetical protein
MVALLVLMTRNVLKRLFVNYLLPLAKTLNVKD